MCWFFKKKKKSDDGTKFATKSKDENITANPVTINPNRPMESTVERAYEKDTSPKIEHNKKTEPEKVEAIDHASKVKEPQKATKQSASVKKETVTKYSGKYEIYPEAGSYKFRLKASNGEILAVSFRYTSEKGALSGIDTFKKNVDSGIFEIYTDKSDYSQFVLYNSNKARVIIIGEFYPNEKQAQSAVESVKKFYNTEKIDILKSIPESDIREELIEIEKVDELSTGKYEIYQEKDNFYVRLKANNAQVLFVSTNYSSKASAKQGLETIKKAISENRFTVGRDKQNRYQFNLYSSTNQLILTGEIYPQKSSCISAINSVRKFAKNAKIIEL